MTKTQIDVVEINAQTNERNERSYTSEELAQIEIDKIARAEMDAVENARAAAKASAIAKLEALGLTEDEAKALIG